MAVLTKAFPSHIAYRLERESGFDTTVVRSKGGYEVRNANWDRFLDAWTLPHSLTLAQFQELDAFHKIVKGRLHAFLLLDRFDYIGTDEWLGDGDGSETDFQILKHYTSYQADFDITSSDNLNDKFTLDGLDLTWLLSAGDFFEVTDSPPISDCDGWYQVSTITYTGGNTEIVVVGDVPDDYGGGGKLKICPRRTVYRPADVDRNGNSIGVTVQVLSGGTWTTKTENTDYTVNYNTGLITFDAGSIPASGEQVRASYQFYKLCRFDSDKLPAQILTDNHVAVDLKIEEVRE